MRNFYSVGQGGQRLSRLVLTHTYTVHVCTHQRDAYSLNTHSFHTHTHSLWHAQSHTHTHTHIHAHTHHRMSMCHSYRIRSMTWNVTSHFCKLPVPTNAHSLTTRVVVNWTRQVHTNPMPQDHMTTPLSHMIPQQRHMTPVGAPPLLRDVDHPQVDLSESLSLSPIPLPPELCPLPPRLVGHS